MIVFQYRKTEPISMRISTEEYIHAEQLHPRGLYFPIKRMRKEVEQMEYYTLTYHIPTKGINDSYNLMDVYYLIGMLHSLRTSLVQRCWRIVLP